MSLERGRIEALLAATPLFGTATSGELAALAARVRMVNLPARSMLFCKGDVGERLYILAKGLVRIGVVSPDGREVTFGLIRPVQVFGEIAVLDGGMRTADATVIEACELAVIERRDMMAFVERSPTVTAHLLTILCQRVRSADNLLQDLFFLTAPGRLAKHLILLGDAVGQKSGADVTIHMSQQEIADQLGISRERVNKLLAKWERTGVVSLWRGKVTLKDLEALEALTDHDDGD